MAVVVAPMPVRVLRCEVVGGSVEVSPPTTVAVVTVPGPVVIGADPGLVASLMARIDQLEQQMQQLREEGI